MQVGWILQSAIDRFITYSRWQQRFIEDRWKLSRNRVLWTPFMVDQEFFAPKRVTPNSTARPQICAVGLERRDYETLLRAVKDLDVHVVIAAASRATIGSLYAVSLSGRLEVGRLWPHMVWPDQYRARRNRGQRRWRARHWRGPAGQRPILYSAGIRGTGVGFWKSTDGGVSWTNYRVAPGGTRQGFYPPVVDPWDTDHLIMSGHQRSLIVQSHDGGRNWSSVPIADGMHHIGGTGSLFFINTGNPATTAKTWLWTAAGHRWVNRNMAHLKRRGNLGTR